MRAPLSLALAALLASAGAARAGEARCWLDRGVLVVPAAFGDIAGDFILDLSSPRSVLHVDVALDAGIVTPQTTAPLRLAGTKTSATLDVASLDARSLGLPSTIEGLIGADALKNRVLDIRFRPCRVRVWRARPPPFRAIATLPIEMAEGVPAIAATLSDGRTALAGRFAIDTGAAPVRLSSRIAALARPAPPGADPASRLDPPARLDALGLAGAVQRRLPAGLEDDLPAELAGSIGTAAWSRYDMQIDLRRGRLELSARAAQPPRPLNGGGAGVGVYSRSSRRGGVRRRSAPTHELRASTPSPALPH